MKDLTFDRDLFFSSYRVQAFGTPEHPARLNQDQAGGLTSLLDWIDGDDAWLADPRLSLVHALAYFLATIKHETADTFQPVSERGGTRAWYAPFFGRGYVQLTLETNYRMVGRRYAGRTFAVPGSDRKPVLVTPETFVREPELVKVPMVSYWIAADGSRDGWFRSRKISGLWRPYKLSDFFQVGKAPDRIQARNIINGTRKGERLPDRAELIASHARNFERALSVSMQIAEV